MKTKVTFIHDKILFKDIEVSTYNNGASYYSTGRGISKVIKTYFKAKHNLKVRTSYDSFSMGSSMTVTIPVPDAMSFDSELSEKFQHGSYDYYTDCQTYKDCTFDSVKICVDGKESYVSFSVKYTSVKNG